MTQKYLFKIKGKLIQAIISPVISKLTNFENNFSLS